MKLTEKEIMELNMFLKIIKPFVHDLKILDNLQKAVDEIELENIQE